MRTRNWSIRSKIIALVTVPLTALLALWIFATVLTAGPALNLLGARTLVNTVVTPGEVLVGQLQRERRLSVEYLSAAPGGTGTMATSLTEQRAATDRAVADFRRSARGGDARRAAGDTLRARIEQLLSYTDGLTAQRTHIDRRELDPIGAQNLYNGMVDAGFEMFGATATFGDEKLDREIGGLTTVGRGQDHLSRVDSLLAGATAAGRFTEDVRAQLVQDVGVARFLLDDGVDELPAANRTAYQKLSNGEAFVELDTMMDTLLARSRTGAVTPVAGTTWHATYVTAGQELRAFEIAATDTLADEATPLAARILIRLALAALLGLIALAVSIVVSVKVGRSIVGRLRRLRAEALEMAGERLPTVVKRLQRGEVVDVDVETPPLEYGKDEIGEVGHAFNDVQRTAVRSAVEEATVRRGLNEVFLNIARRSQTLLHRQLALLDKMERRESEPQELEDLYRVDHLATRMRRHAEDLVILAGAAPGRGWRNPVPMIDVVRGAISEVEDYKRVDIRTVESAAVLGRAVADVIHLLAELLENAASFSPPQTRVQVLGQALPNGYAVEIEDRGLGMSQEEIDEANRRLVEPPDFDPADSARLGLFVVAQLADRHGIRVSLRPSAFGGVTAVVLVPAELIAGGAGSPALPAGSSPPAPDDPWGRPLVGSGAEEPARPSPAALQWQGTEELRQVTVAGRPVTIDGTATATPGSAESPGDPMLPPIEQPTGRPPRVPLAEGDATPLDGNPLRGTPPTPIGAGSLAPLDGSPPAPLGDQQRAPLGGPAPSSVADGLNAEGLVQRRRVRRSNDLFPPGPAPTASPPAARPISATPNPTPVSAAPAQAAPAQAAPAKAVPAKAVPAKAVPAKAVPAKAAPAKAAPAQEEPTQEVPAQEVAPASITPLRAASVFGSPLPSAPPRAAPAPATSLPAVDEPSVEGLSKILAALRAPETKASPADDAPAADDGLPRRVRQANLAPQLRRAAGVEPPEPVAPIRSPDQIRSLMSALQSGTTRGRIDAARYRTEPADSGTTSTAGTEDQSHGEEPDDEGRAPGMSFADAATVSFPAIANVALGRGEAPPGGGNGAAGDHADGPGGSDVTRPEKDTQ